MNKKAHFLKVKLEKNRFGDTWKYQCPICKTWHFRTSKYIHFTSSAKREALQQAAGIIKKTPHLDFYLKHTKEVIKITREWVTVL